MTLAWLRFRGKFKDQRFGPRCRSGNAEVRAQVCLNRLPSLHKLCVLFRQQAEEEGPRYTPNTRTYLLKPGRSETAEVRTNTEKSGCRGRSRKETQRKEFQPRGQGTTRAAYFSNSSVT